MSLFTAVHRYSPPSEQEAVNVRVALLPEPETTVDGPVMSTCAGGRLSTAHVTVTVSFSRTVLSVPLVTMVTSSMSEIHNSSESELHIETYPEKRKEIVSEVENRILSGIVCPEGKQAAIF